MRGPPFPSYAGLQAAIHSERSVSATQFKRFVDKQRERQQDTASSPTGKRAHGYIRFRRQVS
jgi:hypothetical protein